MIPHPHLIARQVLDLQIEDGGDALGLQTEISELFWKDVVPAMNRLLDHWVPPDIVLRLDRLEIDLGRLDPARLGETFPARVCDALEAELSPLLALETSASAKRPGGSERRSPGENALNLWHHLLANGYLPWWASPASAADLEERVGEHLASLDRLPDATRHLLRNNPIARRRLALQGSALTHERVLRLADKALAAASLPMFNAVVALLEAQSVTLIPLERFRQGWWEVALAEAVRPTTNTTAVRSLGLLRQAIINISRKASIAYPGLLTQLRSLIERSQLAARKTISSTQWRDLSAALRDLSETGETKVETVERAGLLTKKERGQEAPDEEVLEYAPTLRDFKSPPGDLVERRDARDATKFPPEDRAAPREGEEPSSMSLPDQVESVEPERWLREDEEPPHRLLVRDGKITAGQTEKARETDDKASPSRRDRARLEGTKKPEDTSKPPEAAFRQPEHEAFGPAPGEEASVPGDSALRPEATGAPGPTTGGERSRSGDDFEADAESAPLGAKRGEDTRSTGFTTPPPTVERTNGSRDLPTVDGAEIEPAEGKERSTTIPAGRAETPTNGRAVAEAEIVPGVPASTTGIREGETLYVDDAGIVLLHPFLQTHFELLGLVRDKSFVDEQARERAVHQLHFLVTGEEEPQEYLLVVAKLLCGLEPETPIARRVPIDDHARSQAEELLAAVIRHWGALKNTSVEGLREAFLQRKGRVTRKADGWSLKVESKTHDILLYRLPDVQRQLPWSLSVVRLPWMAELLWVDWA